MGELLLGNGAREQALRPFVGFGQNVFLNCPFGHEYLPLLFTFTYLGFTREIALEEFASGIGTI